ncbi:MAG: HlyD family efflux transporter periplasmic adaptor subunit [Eubacteriales bacterium]|nr:HlyD family efflux transporter periplasmic adaptor subunit [Eubacteriales bacterium]
MKVNKVFQFVIFLFLLIFLVNSAYNYILNNFIIKTEVIKEGLLLKGYDTQAFIFGNETLIKAESNGPVTLLVTEGQRISKRYPIASSAGQNILSPVSGVVTFKYDKLEEYGDPFESTTFNFEEIKLNYSQEDSSAKKDFLKGDVILKIQDNLVKPKLYLELPISNFKEPLQINQVLSLKFPEEEKPLRLTITKLKGLGQNALIILEFLDMPEKYNRIQDVKIISEQIKTFMIPKKSLTTFNGKEGIYTVVKGLINFKEISIIGEEEEYYLTDSLSTTTEIVSNPRFASEGKYIR